MRSASVALSALVIVLSSCGDSAGPRDRCASLVEVGALDLIITGSSSLDGELLTAGDSVTLAAAVRPITGASEDIYGLCQVGHGAPVAATITWESLDSAVARVWPTGGLRARAAGETTVVARDEQRALEAEWSVTVLP